MNKVKSISSHILTKTIHYSAFVISLHAIHAFGATPGQSFETVFGVDSSVLGASNVVSTVDSFSNAAFSTNEWTISFSGVSTQSLNQVVSFSVVDLTNAPIAVGAVELCPTPTHSFWRANAQICANSLPLFVHAEQWMAESQPSSISFMHKYPSADHPDKAIHLFSNVFILAENCSTAQLSFPLVFDWIKSVIRTPTEIEPDAEP